MTNRPERYTELDTVGADAVASWLRSQMDALQLTTQTQLVKLTREKGHYVSDATIRPLMNAKPGRYRTDKLRDLSLSLTDQPDAVERAADGHKVEIPAPAGHDMNVRVAALERAVDAMREAAVTQTEKLDQILRRLDGRA